MSKATQNAQKRMYNVQKPCKVTCATLRTFVGVLYADGARFTHRFVREQRRFGLEIEGITHYDKSIAQRKVKKKKISLCVAMRLKRSKTVVLPPVYHPTNF